MLSFYDKRVDSGSFRSDGIAVEPINDACSRSLFLACASLNHLTSNRETHRGMRCEMRTSPSHEEYWMMRKTGKICIPAHDTVGAFYSLMLYHHWLANKKSQLARHIYFLVQRVIFSLDPRQSYVSEICAGGPLSRCLADTAARPRSEKVGVPDSLQS